MKPINCSSISTICIVSHIHMRNCIMYMYVSLCVYVRASMCIYIRAFVYVQTHARTHTHQLRDAQCLRNGLSARDPCIVPVTSIYNRIPHSRQWHFVDSVIYVYWLYCVDRAACWRFLQIEISNSLFIFAWRYITDSLHLRFIWKGNCRGRVSVIN